MDWQPARLQLTGRYACFEICAPIPLQAWSVAHFLQHPSIKSQFCLTHAVTSALGSLNRRAEDTGSCGKQRGEKGMLFQD